MLCPVCAVELTIAERQGIEIDYCPSCRGIWLDRGELDKIIERTATFNAEPAPTGYRGGKKHPYRGTHHHERDDDYPDKPKRGYKGSKKHAYRGTHHHEREYEYGERRYRDDDRRYRDDKRRYKKSKKRRASDLLEEIFDIFD